jgi:hypothetical protein
LSKVIIICLAAIAGLIAIGAVLLGAKMQRAQREDARLTSLFVPDPNNQTMVVVRGWKQVELQKIVADFLPMYGIPRLAVAIASGERVLEIRFPSDIQPKLLMFLVNYVQNPKGFDLSHRSIGVVAHVVLTPAFGAPSPNLVGRRATIYVPANDTDYDVVYVRTESGETYRVPFSEMKWDRTDDPRLPRSAEGL